MNSPLHSLHEVAEADFQPYGETLIVSTFGEPQAEYAAIHKAAAVMDMPQRGALELTGKDRLAFLNNLLTNETWSKERKAGLAGGGGVYAFFLNAKGRVVTDVNVLELGERTLLEMDARLVEGLRQTLEKYLFAEQVKMRSLAGEAHELFLTGPKALEALNAIVNEPVGELAPLGNVQRMLEGEPVTIFRDDVCGVMGLFLLSSAAGVEKVWRRLTHQPEAEGAGGAVEQFARFRGLARPTGWAAFNATRIEAGRPLFGIDFDETVLPAETGQFQRAVSVTKGCYLGQEIVARMYARNQVARQLVGIRMEGDALPIAGSKVYDEAQNEIGGVTSSTPSPVMSNVALCLGMVKRAFTAPGTRVIIPAEGAMRVGVVEGLPFAKKI